MKKIEKLSKKWNSLLYNHLWLKFVVENSFALIATAFSAAIFTFGLNIFLDPAVQGGAASGINSMVSGGSSGAAQVLKVIFVKIFSVKNESLLYSAFYLAINAPLIYIAFRYVGKRFAVYTLINVALVTLFANIFHGQLFIDIAVFIDEQSGMLGRALFAGICTGLSSATAYKIDASAGGFDIISYYISSKKSTLTGKYSFVINGVIIASFAFCTAFSTYPYAFDIAISGIFFSAVYLLTVMLVIDVINIRNKKAQIQIITTKKDLAKLLLANIPHGATLVDAKGAYSESERYIVYMVVSTTEVKHAVKVIKQLDPESFVNVTALQQVYGNFHMKPIK